MTIPHKIPILLSLLMLLSLQSATADDMNTTSVWQQLKKNHFGQRLINNNATDILFIEVPTKIEDAAMMPITIKSLTAQTAEYHIKTLHLIVDNNPQPYSAAFHLSPKLGPITISTRIRMDNFSHIRVIAEMNDNSLHMVTRFVVASGGCSAPASKDPSVSAARLGKIQLRMRNTAIGQTTPVQMIISHPNASGMQFDQQSQQFIPIHYVTNIDIRFNDEPLITVETGITISENPSIRFNFTPDTAGTLKATITDSKHAVYIAEKQIN
ncbi:MAG: quinoprotein dehydrogenase-associated SoxYZ-like carrier [Gammaproteobacteria bacterium]|nr:quinoprotein dehydrogenase-associated SoxYZ-like carrier [Gammaproteobacteria bacterium]